MQNPNAKGQLSLTAAALARYAPKEWGEFVEALSLVADQHRENLVQSTLAELPVNQGRAQILSNVVFNLRNCITEADKIKGMK